MVIQRDFSEIKTAIDLIFRYDNAAHKPALPFREHKHLPQQILPAPTPALTDVLTEIFIIQSQA